MYSINTILSLFVIGLTMVCVAKGQVNEEKRQVILIVKNLISLKALYREISALDHLQLTYENNVPNLERNIVEKAIQQGVNYTVPANSYALILTTMDEISTDAIYAFLEKYTTVRDVDVIIESKNRRKRIVPQLSVGLAILNVVKNTVLNNVGPGASYAKKVLDASSKGLAVFSVGMAAVSIVPNPVTPPVGLATGAASLGLSIARDAIN